MRKQSFFRVPAIKINQGKNRQVYSFAVDGKMLSSFSSVSRISRNREEGLDGYQRHLVKQHIREISSYLESDNPMLPNSVVIAFNESVVFVPLDPSKESTNGGCQGELVIPIPDEDTEEKPGWIVDGQQRIAAVNEARIDSFLMFATAFITSEIKEQSEQFILVNSTKPLPKGLIYELLPGTEGKLSSALEKKRFPAVVMEHLNQNTKSPLYKVIQTATNPRGVLKDNSILKMLENSLSDGALHLYRDPSNGNGDLDKILPVLFSFWDAVRTTFSAAWGLPPRQSRLLHGAGVISLGFIMDAICETGQKGKSITTQEFEEELATIQDFCQWTEGHWNFGDGDIRRWDQVQNTPSDINMLANFLLIKYRENYRIRVKNGGQSAASDS